METAFSAPPRDRLFPQPSPGETHLITQVGARVPRFARFRILAVFVATLAAVAPLLTAADGAVSSLPPVPVSYILVGFAGGFVRHDNVLHGPVRLAQKIRPESPKGAFIQVFENRHRK